jgi:hypothetical protein
LIPLSGQILISGGKKMKTLAWMGSKGQKIELRAFCKTTLVDDIINADGDKINVGKKIQTKANLELWVDDKKIDSCWDTDFWKIIDVKPGLKKIWGLPVAMTPEQAEIVEKFLKEIIESGKSEEVKTEETAKAEAEKAKRRARAQRIVDAAEKYTTPLMTDAEYRVWARNYNHLHNEGGDGYIPERITVEQLKDAKKVLAEQ